MNLVHIKISVISQTNVLVQPATSENYNYPASIAAESQQLANELKRPVILVGKNGDKCEFKSNS